MALERQPKELTYIQELQAKTNRDVAMLKPVTGAVVCSLHVPQTIMTSIMASKTAFDSPLESIRDIIRGLQQRDAFVIDRQYESMPNRTRNARSSRQVWQMDDNGLLRHKRALYVPKSLSVQSEILAVNHNDLHVGHFGFYHTLDLVRRKYYWPGIRSEIKGYI